MLGSVVLVYSSLYILERYSVLRLALPDSIQSFRFRLIFSGIFFLTLLNSVLTSYLLSFKKFRAVSIYGVGFQALQMLVFVSMYYGLIPYNTANPIESVVYVLAGIALVSVAIVLYVFKSILRIQPGHKLIPLTLIKQFVFFSTLAYLGNLATFFSYKLDFWIVDFYWGKENLGVYSLASQLSQLIWILPSAIASVLYSYASQSSEEEAVRYTITLKQIAFYGSALLALVGMILAYFFIPVLYGNDFAPAFGLMKILMIGVIPFSIPTVLASLFAARGNFKTSFVISIVVFVFSAMIYFILIPEIGMTGGAIGSALSYIAGAVICETWFCRKYQISYLNLFLPDRKIFSIKGLRRFLKV